MLAVLTFLHAFAGKPISRAPLLNLCCCCVPFVFFCQGYPTTPTAITAGGWHTCAIVTDGGGTQLTKCWGSNIGELGLGDSGARGHAIRQMGNDLAPVDLGKVSPPDPAVDAFFVRRIGAGDF